MRFFYGDYEHLDGECYPARIEIIPAQSEDGLRWCSIYRMEVKGHFVDVNPELTPAEVDDRIEAMNTAYLNDYQDCGFRLTDGTLTQHHMVSDDTYNLSGNIIKYRSWDNMLPTEFANSRSFSVVIEAKYLQSYDSVLMFTESVTKYGNAGERWKMYNNWGGDPYKETVFPQTKVVYVQQGTVIGTTQKISAPSPLWPSDEQQWKRVIRTTSPRFHGDLDFIKGTHYRTDYKYFFERTAADEVTGPNYWIP